MAEMSPGGLDDDTKLFNYIMCGVSLGILVLVALLAKGMYEWKRKAQHRLDNAPHPVATTSGLAAGGGINREAWNKKNVVSTNNKVVSESRENLVMNEHPLPGAVMAPSGRSKPVAPVARRPPPPGGTTESLVRPRMCNGDPQKSAEIRSGSQVALRSRSFDFVDGTGSLSMLNVPLQEFSLQNETRPIEVAPAKPQNSSTDSTQMTANVDDFLLQLESRLGGVVNRPDAGRVVGEVGAGSTSESTNQLGFGSELTFVNVADSCGSGTALDVTDAGSSSTLSTEMTRRPVEPPASSTAATVDASSLCNVYTSSSDEGVVAATPSPSSTVSRNLGPESGDFKLTVSPEVPSASVVASSPSLGIGSAASTNVLV